MARLPADGDRRHVVASALQCRSAEVFRQTQARRKTAVTAAASLLYDLENDIVVDAQIAPLSRGERSLAEENLKALQALDSFNSGYKELVVFDRGYHSHQFINSISDKQITYVMRVKNGFFRKRGTF